jgi:hypothetical protein
MFEGQIVSLRRTFTTIASPIMHQHDTAAPGILEHIADNSGNTWSLPIK